MYKAYKITDNNDFKEIIEDENKSRIYLLENKLSASSKILKPKLLEMIKCSSLADDELNAKSIWDEWFPEIEADVFISHSSKDAGLAKKFAVWLKTNFDLTAFIDSEIWGDSEDLLRKIDDEYCQHSDGKSYFYEKRNDSTAHVHMMLSYALTRMIDKTECFIFLGSNNSINVKDSVEGTYSPWIFHELATVDTIELKEKRDMSKVASLSYKIFSEAHELKANYPTFGKRLKTIDYRLLEIWQSQNRDLKSHALDNLYKLTEFKQ